MNQDGPARVLLIDPSPELRAARAGAPDAAGWRTVEAADAERVLDQWGPHVVVTSADAASSDALARLRRWRVLAADADVVVVRASDAAVGTSDLLRAGAAVVVGLPVESDGLVAEVQRAYERSLLRAENERLRRQLDAPARFPHVIGQSKRMRELLDLVSAVAASDANVLILGENGSGKELIADAVHQQSARAAGRFIKINCAAIPRDLIESELFGYRRGAFTGALGDKAGLLAMAEGGSVLLDEVGEMPSHLQAKLLRVLQEREYRPLGSDHVVRVNFRLICATNVDVTAALRAGRLREDLYFRINTITARVPPLRERLEDLAPLCQHFLQLYTARHGRQVRAISPAAYQRMMRHHWPGNVRELENVIERGVLVARGDEITHDDLPEALAGAIAVDAAGSGAIPAHLTLDEIERLAIVTALDRTGGNKQEAARQLGLYRPTLYSKIQKHGIVVTRRRAAGRVAGGVS